MFSQHDVCSSVQSRFISKALPLNLNRGAASLWKFWTWFRCQPIAARQLINAFLFRGTGSSSMAATRLRCPYILHCPSMHAIVIPSRSAAFLRMRHFSPFSQNLPDVHAHASIQHLLSPPLKSKLVNTLSSRYACTNHLSISGVCSSSSLYSQSPYSSVFELKMRRISMPSGVILVSFRLKSPAHSPMELRNVATAVQNADGDCVAPMDSATQLKFPAWQANEHKSCELGPFSLLSSNNTEKNPEA